MPPREGYRLVVVVVEAYASVHSEREAWAGRLTNPATYGCRNLQPERLQPALLTQGLRQAEEPHLSRDVGGLEQCRPSHRQKLVDHTCGKLALWSREGGVLELAVEVVRLAQAAYPVVARPLLVDDTDHPSHRLTGSGASAYFLYLPLRGRIYRGLPLRHRRSHYRTREASRDWDEARVD